MAEKAFIGEIRVFGINFVPEGWLPCDGKILSIHGHSALFALLGKSFGGDGETTFALPDLRGRIPMGAGNEHKYPERYRGHKFGSSQSKVLTHTHQVSNLSVKIKALDDVNNPSNDKKAKNNILGTPTFDIYSKSEPNIAMAKGTVQLGETTSAGKSVITNFQPSLVMNYCICSDGIMPKAGKEE